MIPGIVICAYGVGLSRVYNSVHVHAHVCVVAVVLCYWRLAEPLYTHAKHVIYLQCNLTMSMTYVCHLQLHVSGCVSITQRKLGTR